MLLSPPLARIVDPRGVKALVTSAPGQVHSVPTAGTTWMFLNVRRAPFDDIRVRRAVNLATDRAALVELAGGPEIASPACQIVPHGVPGLRARLRLHGQPVTRRRVDRARPRARAPADRGVRDARGSTSSSTCRRHSGIAIGRYFVSLLRELGFHARMRVLPIGPYFQRIETPGSRDQMGFVGWAADFISPSSFIDGNFTCTPPAAQYDGNPSHLCDRGVDPRGGARAGDRRRRRRRRPGRRPTAASSTSRPPCPTTNDRTLIFVSKRVGNVTHHAQWTTLLDQMWVR